LRSPLCFFWFGWRTFPESWRSGFCQALTADEAVTRRAWGLIEYVEPARLSPCQQSKRVAFGFSGLLENDYYLQKAFEAGKNPRVVF
jgi:hypothetical protein